MAQIFSQLVAAVFATLRERQKAVVIVSASSFAIINIIVSSNIVRYQISRPCQRSLAAITEGARSNGGRKRSTRF